MLLPRLPALALRRSSCQRCCHRLAPSSASSRVNCVAASAAARGPTTLRPAGPPATALVPLRRHRLFRPPDPSTTPCRQTAPTPAIAAAAAVKVRVHLPQLKSAALLRRGPALHRHNCRTPRQVPFPRPKPPALLASPRPASIAASASAPGLCLRRPCHPTAPSTTLPPSVGHGAAPSPRYPVRRLACRPVLRPAFPTPRRPADPYLLASTPTRPRRRSAPAALRCLPSPAPLLCCSAVTLPPPPRRPPAAAPSYTPPCRTPRPVSHLLEHESVEGAASRSPVEPKHHGVLGGVALCGPAGGNQRTASG